MTDKTFLKTLPLWLLAAALSILVILLILMWVTGTHIQYGNGRFGFVKSEYMNIEKIAAGSTVVGKTDWMMYKDIEGTGFRLHVSTESAGFKSTPVYLVSLGGKDDLCWLTGAASVYNPTPKGFEIHLRYHAEREENISTETPNKKEWHINWLGIELKK